MNIRTALAAIVIAAASGPALAQTPVYTFEMRLVPDGAAGAPSGLGTAFPIGDPGGTLATRIGFWLQARVSQVGGENWGIVRATSPAGGQSFVRVASTAGGVSLQLGTVNAGNTLRGRGSGYRFNGVLGQNGQLDNGGSGAAIRRAYGFDCYVGDFRADLDADFDGDIDDDGDGLPENPWRINGATSPGDASGVPVPDGVFSPWANLYRVWIDIADPATARSLTVDASALLAGSVSVGPQFPGDFVYPIVTGPGREVSASYSFSYVPAPSAAGVLCAAGLLATARRR